MLAKIRWCQGGFVCLIRKGLGEASIAGFELAASILPIPKIRWGHQAKHFPGHNNYEVGRSPMTANPEKLARKAGTGQKVGKLDVGLPGSKERVNFGEIIGNNVDPETGIATPTTVGVIHYGKDGIHIVPGGAQK